MKLTSVAAIMRALNDAEVRYLVVGGLAVSAHGYLRYTKDVDLVVQLVPANIERAFAALGGLGYGVTVPVTATEFANAELRQSWIRDKGMLVLSLWSDAHRETPVDLFVIEPFPFDEERAQAVVKHLPGAGPVPFVTIPTLIRLKEAANRPEDQIDIAHLKQRLEDDGRPD